jgi:hypothetical protein
MTQPTPFTCSYSFANAFTANLTMVFPAVRWTPISTVAGSSSTT